MRCPYCGGINADQAKFCAYCGRDVISPPRQQQQRPVYPPQPSPAPGRPVQSPPMQQPGRPSAVPPVNARGAGSRRTRTSAPGAPVATPIATVPDAPEAPAPFPPRTIADLFALEQGALEYTVLDSSTSYNHKNIVNIVFQRCTPWQQVATLLKALKANPSPDCNTVIILGSYSDEPTIYEFTQGKLQFDRDARLGSQLIKRYQVETGNGLDSDSLRMVFTE